MGGNLRHGARVPYGLGSLRWVAVLFLLSGCSPPPQATQHCARVIASKPEATLAPDGSRVLRKLAFEGVGLSDAAGPAVPNTELIVAAPQSENMVAKWYGDWLTQHGWQGPTTSTATDTPDVVVHDWTWHRGDDDFLLRISLGSSQRSRYGITDTETLVTTSYDAPATDLGCQ